MKLNHLAIIMDGNRRWAISNNLPSYHGHQKGAENLWNMIDDIDNYSFKYLTVFIFSTEIENELPKNSFFPLSFFKFSGFFSSESF